MADKARNINYLNREFNDFRNSLVEYSKAYFPNTYNDFTDTSTGMLFMEMASYVGDVLSFYLDNQIQETFIQYARQTENIYNLAYFLGYKPKVTTAASVEIDFYQQLPAKLDGGVTIPDYDYCLRIPENTPITANYDASIKFLTQDVVDFSHSSSLDPTEISVYELSGTQPTYYLLKKTRKAISATINTTSLVFSGVSKFDTRNLTSQNIIGVLDCYDTEGNQWYEVDNLSQESVFDYEDNISTKDPNYSDDLEVRNILKLKKVQRRFVTRFINRETLEIQFGAGSTGNNDEEIVPNPDNVGLGLPFEKTKLTTAFSPVNFVYTNTYGIAPADTTLTLRYLTGGGVTSNVESGALTSIGNSGIYFIKSGLNNSLGQTIFDSLACNNEKAADGGSDGDDIDEVRQNALGNFQNQLRTVTPQDYMIRALSLPPDLGVVNKAFIEPTKIADYQPGELPSVMCMYILSSDANGKLRTASKTLKKNLATYLSEYRMVNDSVKIKDAYIINIGVEFDIVVNPNYNSNEVLNNCISSFITYFETSKWQINQPISIKALTLLLDKVVGVEIVNDVKIVNKTGGDYGSYAYDVDAAIINKVVYPSLDPMVFEVKFPTQDIKGRVSTI